MTRNDEIRSLGQQVERRPRQRERKAELKNEIGSILPSPRPSGMEGHSVREDVVIRRTLLESLVTTFGALAKTGENFWHRESYLEIEFYMSLLEAVSMLSKPPKIGSQTMEPWNN